MRLLEILIHQLSSPPDYPSSTSLTTKFVVPIPSNFPTHRVVRGPGRKGAALSKAPSTMLIDYLRPEPKEGQHRRCDR